MEKKGTTKYGKYILKQSPGKNQNIKTPATMDVILDGAKNWGGIRHRMKWMFVTKPVRLIDKPHSHDFDEVLCFFSGNPTRELDFGAEIELSMGTEGEKQVIKSPSIVCLPKGLVHCPVNFKKITQPILFVRIHMSPEYVRKTAS